MREVSRDLAVRVYRYFENNLHHQYDSRALANEIIVGGHSAREWKFAIRIERGFSTSNETIFFTRSQVCAFDALPVGV